MRSIWTIYRKRNKAKHWIRVTKRNSYNIKFFQVKNKDKDKLMCNSLPNKSVHMIIFYLFKAQILQFYQTTKSISNTERIPIVPYYIGMGLL
jgi:hypothetical protein